MIGCDEKVKGDLCRPRFCRRVLSRGAIRKTAWQRFHSCAFPKSLNCLKVSPSLPLITSPHLSSPLDFYFSLPLLSFFSFFYFSFTFLFWWALSVPPGIANLAWTVNTCADVRLNFWHEYPTFALIHSKAILSLLKWILHQRGLQEMTTLFATSTNWTIPLQETNNSQRCSQFTR